jgi:transcriptional regulator with XRE-family HTH domain
MPSGSKPDLYTFLQAELKKRKLSNPAYSIRAFARSLGLGPTTLSQSLNGKRALSKKNRKKVVSALKLSEEYLSSKSPVNDLTDADFDLIQDDIFASMSSWQDFAVLCLADMPENQGNPGWISKRLGIPMKDAEEVLQRLIRLGFLRVQEGKMQPLKSPNLRTTDEKQSLALRTFHQKCLEKARKTIEIVPLHLRDYSLITLPMKAKDLAKGKQMIKAFRRKFGKTFDNPRSGDVFTLAIQLFPLTALEDSEKL